MTEHVTAPAFDPAQHGWTRHDGEGFIDYIGPVWEKQTDAGLSMGILTDPRHHNRRGVVQGGMLMAFSDRAMGMSARQQTGGLPQATIQLDYHFLGATQIGEFIETTPRVLRKTRSMIFVQAELLVGGRLVGSANGVWKILGAA